MCWTFHDIPSWVGSAAKHEGQRTPVGHIRKPARELIRNRERHDEFLADFTIDFTIALARELGNEHTRFLRSSELAGIDGQKTDRLIQILQVVDATHYISGPSARDYIEKEKFESAGIGLEYMEYNYPEYLQLYPPFDPHVSILDLLFMTGPEAPNYIFEGSHV